MALALAKRGGGMEGVMCNRHECVLLYRHSWQWSTHKLGFGPMSLGFVTPPRVIDPRLLLVNGIRVLGSVRNKKKIGIDSLY